MPSTHTVTRRPHRGPSITLTITPGAGKVVYTVQAKRIRGTDPVAVPLLWLTDRVSIAATLDAGSARLASLSAGSQGDDLTTVRIGGALNTSAAFEVREPGASEGAKPGPAALAARFQFGEART